MSTIYTQSLALTRSFRPVPVCLSVHAVVGEWAELLFNTVSYRYKSLHPQAQRFYGYFGRVNCFQVSHFTYSIPFHFNSIRRVVAGECVDINISHSLLHPDEDGGSQLSGTDFCLYMFGRLSMNADEGDCYSVDQNLWNCIRFITTID